VGFGLGFRFGFGLVNIIGICSWVLCLVVHRNQQLAVRVRVKSWVGVKVRVRVRVNVWVRVRVRVALCFLVPLANDSHLLTIIIL
jgi:hypothetical protein